MSGRLDAVREKLNAMKDAIEQSQDRESDAKLALKKALERAAKAEEDAASYKRRIDLLNKEWEKTQEKIRENMDSLSTFRDKIEQERATEKQLGGLELDTDEQLNDIEIKAKEAEVRRDEKQRELNDVCRKRTKTELDVSRAVDRAEKAETRIEAINNELKNAGDNVSKLEARDEEASEREGILEEKIAFLEEQMKGFVARYEAAEREQRKAERHLDEVTMDIEVTKEKKGKVENEFAEILDAVGQDEA